MYEYHARVVDIVDGDTLDVVVDCGFHIRRRIRLRLSGVDTAEVYGVSHDSDEYERGRTHSEFVSEWLSVAERDDRHWPLVVRTNKTGKYGRYLATVERRTDGAILNDDLIDEFGVESEG